MSEDSEQKKDTFAEDSERAIKLQSNRRFQLIAKYGAELGEKMYQKELAEAKVKISDDLLTMKLGKAERLLAELEKDEDVLDTEKKRLLRIREDFLLAEKEAQKINEQIKEYKDVLRVVYLVNRELANHENTNALTLRFERKGDLWSLVDVVREPLFNEKEIRERFEANKKASLDRAYGKGKWIEGPDGRVIAKNKEKKVIM